jgi:hypothetical protein
MPSHLVDQPLIDQLPPLLLVNWAAAYCQSKTSGLDLQLVTLRVLEHLFKGLSITYGIDSCGHLVCRRCLARFKCARLRGSDAAVHRYLTCVLHKVANEGDNDTCHRSTSNDTLKSKLRVPSEEQVSSALAIGGVCPLFLPCLGPTQAQAASVPSSGGSGFSSTRVLHGGEYTERKTRGWEDPVSGQVVELRRHDLGASLVPEGVPARPQRVPSPPPFWRPFVPAASAVHSPATPCAVASPLSSPSSVRTVAAYSSGSDRRSRSPCSERSDSSSPSSLFDAEWFEAGVLSPIRDGGERSP